MPTKNKKQIEKEIDKNNEDSENNYSESESIKDNSNGSDNVPDEDDFDEDTKQELKKKKLNSDFLDKIIKYISTDDLIRQETIEFREKVNTLKERKAELESHIMRYMDIIDEKQVNMDNKGSIVKYESVRKGAINKDIIKESIYEQLKKENMIQNEKEGRALAEITYDIMEKKREIKKTVKIKRIVERKKKPAKEKKGSINEVIERKPQKKNIRKSTK